jgi:hypothetical protein
MMRLRRTAGDPKLARDFLLRTSMIASLQRVDFVSEAEFTK